MILTIIASILTGLVFRGIIMGVFKAVTKLDLPILGYPIGILTVVSYLITGFGGLEEINIYMVIGLVTPELIQTPVGDWFNRIVRFRRRMIDSNNAEKLNKILKDL